MTSASALIFGRLPRSRCRNVGSRTDLMPKGPVMDSIDYVTPECDGSRKGELRTGFTVTVWGMRIAPGAGVWPMGLESTGQLQRRLPRVPLDTERATTRMRAGVGGGEGLGRKEMQ